MTKVRKANLRRKFANFAAVSTVLLLCGCSSPSLNGRAPSITAAFSPLSGKWTGKSHMKDRGIGNFVNALEGGPLTGPSSLTLNPDGTSFLKVADKPERPISWKQEGGKVILDIRTP